MRRAVKYIYNTNPLYIHLKKHYCPKCGNKVKVSDTKKTINSKSEEAKEYDFSVGDTYFVGEVEFRTKCFYCGQCGLSISVEKMREYEKAKQDL